MTTDFNSRKADAPKKSYTHTDVIVIGAGVSGLAAAGALAKQGWRVRILEARGRSGGRIFSKPSAGGSAAIELGAEFVHGGNPAIRKIFKRAGISTRSVKASVWWRDRQSGVLALLPDYWDRIGEVVDGIPGRAAGWSFQQFLDRKRSELSPANGALAEHYVGGFEAAPTSEISAKALREDRAGTATNDLKIVGRYDQLIRELKRAWLPQPVRLMLNSPVTAIGWKRGAVSVESESALGKKRKIYSARAVVVTLPLGVLRTKRVKFFPALREKQKLIARLGWGHVVRIVLRFKPGFWSAPFMPRTLGAASGRDFGFVNAPGQALPVWWALSPPAPVLTAWAGGEASRPLRHRSPETVRKEALHSLAAILGTAANKLRPWLAGWQCHQWSDDPFSLGSYSFPVAGLESGAAQLARPVLDTLFFAGEATAKEYGTVHGALESGLRAAREVDAALRSKRK